MELLVGSSIGWSRRALLLAGAALALAGCGFHPLYADHAESGFDADLASIKVNTIKDRLGQLLTSSLRDGLNPSGAKVAPRYVLDVKLTVTRAELGILATGTASRAQVTVNASFVLRELPGTGAVLQGSTRTVSAFDTLTDDYATTVAQQSAEERSIGDLSDDIRTRVAAFVKQRRAANAS